MQQLSPFDLLAGDSTGMLAQLIGFLATAGTYIIVAAALFAALAAYKSFTGSGGKNIQASGGGRSQMRSGKPQRPRFRQNYRFRRRRRT